MRRGVAVVAVTAWAGDVWSRCWREGASASFSWLASSVFSFPRRCPSHLSWLGLCGAKAKGEKRRGKGMARRGCAVAARAGLSAGVWACRCNYGSIQPSSLFCVSCGVAVVSHLSLSVALLTSSCAPPRLPHPPLAPTSPAGTSSRALCLPVRKCLLIFLL